MPFTIYSMHLGWIQVLISLKKYIINGILCSHLKSVHQWCNIQRHLWFEFLFFFNLSSNDKMFIFKWTTALTNHSLMYSATHHVHECCEHLNRAPCQAVIRSQNRSAIPHFYLSSKCLKVTQSPGVQTPWCCYSCINRFSNPSLRSCPHLHHYFGD